MLRRELVKHDAGHRRGTVRTAGCASGVRARLPHEMPPQAAKAAGGLARPVLAVPHVGGPAAAGHPPVPRPVLTVRIARGRQSDPDRRAQTEHWQLHMNDLNVTVPRMDDNPIALQPTTLAAIDAVQRGLRLACDSAGSAEVHPKAGRDVVTDADVAAEVVIRQVLAERTELPVVGEEHGGQVPADGSAYWLVDPICGTRNYASGVPMWSVNVAMTEGGAVTAAVVGDASRLQVHVAERGRGA